MRLVDAPLLSALRDPAVMLGFSQADWDLVVRQGLSAGLLGRLGAKAQEHGLTARIPTPIWRHMEAMLSIADKQRQAVLWEVKLLSRALVKVDAPVVLLKGAAYAVASLPPAAGRTFSDIDILVPKAVLSEVEKQLFLSGWVTTQHDAYDQRYYRQWMHELPPMTHIHRGTNLDVHHSILPESARIKTRPELILAAARPLEGFPNIFIPSAEDQVLHSATHLYHEGEWDHGLRDLSDLDCLLRAYGEGEAFWSKLMARAEELNLIGPLEYALRHARTLLNTPLQLQAWSALFSQSGTLHGTFMDTLFLSGMACAHASLRQPATGLAQTLLYIRSHWLRMPLHLLLPHLLRKALVKPEEGSRTKTEPQRP